MSTCSATWPYMVVPGNHESECHSPRCLTDPTVCALLALHLALTIRRPHCEQSVCRPRTPSQTFPATMPASACLLLRVVGLPRCGTASTSGLSTWFVTPHPFMWLHCLVCTTQHRPHHNATMQITFDTETDWPDAPEKGLCMACKLSVFFPLCVWLCMLLFLCMNKFWLRVGQLGRSHCNCNSAMPTSPSHKTTTPKLRTFQIRVTQAYCLQGISLQMVCLLYAPNVNPSPLPACDQSYAICHLLWHLSSQASN